MVGGRRDGEVVEEKRCRWREGGGGKREKNRGLFVKMQVSSWLIDMDLIPPYFKVDLSGTGLLVTPPLASVRVSVCVKHIYYVCVYSIYIMCVCNVFCFSSVYICVCVCVCVCVWVYCVCVDWSVSSEGSVPEGLECRGVEGTNEDEECVYLCK